MMKKKKLLVWWLRPDESVFIEAALQRNLFTEIPTYIKTLIRGLSGVDGRGRLWLSPRTTGQAEVQWDETTALAARAKECGGIVILESDAPAVWLLVEKHLLGFLTDLRLGYKTF